MKKKYNKKKQNFQKLQKSGSGRKDSDAASKALEEYKFLFWLDDYTRQYKKPKSNVMSDCYHDDKSLQGAEMTPGNDDLDVPYPDLEVDDDKNLLDDDESPSIAPPLKRSLPAPMSHKASKRSKVSSDIVATAELEVMSSFNKALKCQIEEKNRQKQDDEDDLFGKIIATELRKFKATTKFHVKHEINNIIYKFQLSEVEQAMQQPRNLFAGLVSSM